MNAGSDLLRVTLQSAFEPVGAELPTEQSFRTWVNSALAGAGGTCSGVCATVRVVDAAESAALNNRYRGKDGPTNVLAFPAGVTLLPAEAQDEAELGDLVICAAVAASEAAGQNKSFEAHLAHLTVHGTLHLLGYDHDNAQDAAAMEGLEQRIMAELGFDDPYAAGALAE